MDILEASLPPAGSLGDPAADDAIRRFADAVSAGTPATAGMPAEVAACGAQIVQANQKAATGQPLRNWSELVAFAQFGPAALGRAVALLCGEGGDGVQTCAALWTARFLAHRVREARSAPALVPDGVLRRHGADRATLAAAATAAELRGAFDEMLARARDTLPAAARARAVAHRGLRRHVLREILTTDRLLQRLAVADPLATDVALTWADRARLAVRLCLHRDRAT